jgi:hypothetical protein
MRTATVSAWVILLWLTGFPNPAAAQEKVAAQTHLSLLPLPKPTQVFSLPKGESQRAGVLEGLPGNPASALRALHDRAAQVNLFTTPQSKDRPAEIYGVQPLPYLSLLGPVPAKKNSCAHLLIRRLPSADSKMVKRMWGGSDDDMAATAGLPPCREDIR